MMWVICIYKFAASLFGLVCFWVCFAFAFCTWCFVVLAVFVCFCLLVYFVGLLN